VWAKGLSSSDMGMPTAFHPLLQGRWRTTLALMAAAWAFSGVMGFLAGRFSMGEVVFDRIVKSFSRPL
jgi:hypothetical protein